MRVGVVSSRSGAAIHDFLRVLKRRAPGVDILLAPSLVQGAGAARELSSQLARLDALGLDLIVLTRGGGSLEDLWAFNEELLVRAVAACKTPVVSAVGHEVDLSLCDLAADLRAPTPSAAAELIVPVWREQLEGLRGRGETLEQLMRIALERRIHRLDRLRSLLSDPRLSLARYRQTLDELFRSLQTSLERSLRKRQDRHRALEGTLRGLHPARRLRRDASRLASLEARLRSLAVELLSRRRTSLTRSEAKLAMLSPLATLSRGFALVQDQDGRVVSEARGLSLGGNATLRFAKGRALVQTLQIEDEEPPLTSTPKT